MNHNFFLYNKMSGCIALILSIAACCVSGAIVLVGVLIGTKTISINALLDTLGLLPLVNGFIERCTVDINGIITCPE